MRPGLLAVGLLLTACGTTSYYGNENSPYYVVQTGSRLTLNEELNIAPQSVSVFLQDGRLLTFAEVNKYHPFCKFELYSMHSAARTVAPDSFEVIKALQEEAHSVDAGNVMLARLSIGVGIGIGMIDGGGRSITTYATRMQLRSAEQPDVFRLSCAHWVYPPYDQHVTIAEMRKALGNVFTLELAGAR